MVLPSKPATKRIRVQLLLIPIIVLTLALLLALSILSFSLNSATATMSTNALLRSNNVQMEEWKAHEAVTDRSTIGTTIPTGSYVYRGSNECQRAPHCTIHFPVADLSSLIQVDELLMPDAPPVLGENQQSFLANATISYENTNNDFMLLTRRGHKGLDQASKNQDRIVFVKEQKSLIAALFDGHGLGGHVVSHAAALLLPQLLSVGSTRMNSAVLESAILGLDMALPEEVGAGSTAIVIVKQEGRDEVWVANVGDSTGLVCEYNPVDDTTSILYQTKPHKPGDPEERSRIERNGGRVWLPQVHGESSRVIIPMGHMEMALAMSRSLGDVEGKRMGFVTAQPTIDRVSLEGNSKMVFVVAVTDGLVDFLPPKDVANHLGQVLFGSRKDTVRLVDECAKLILRASMAWKQNTLSSYRDDISLLVSKL